MRFMEYAWDYDGTLIDSYPYIVETYRQGLLSLGIDLDATYILSLAKRSLMHADRVVGERFCVEPERIREAYHSHLDVARYEALELFEGIPELLAEIVRLGGRNHLYTHSGVKAVHGLENKGIRQYFTGIITAENGFPLKPAPDALLHLIREQGLEPGRSVMVGDRDIDVEAGHNAGIAGALFDPDGYYRDLPVALRFASIREMRDAFLT